MEFHIILINYLFILLYLIVHKLIEILFLEDRKFLINKYMYQFVKGTCIGITTTFNDIKYFLLEFITWRFHKNFILFFMSIVKYIIYSRIQVF